MFWIIFILVNLFILCPLCFILEILSEKYYIKKHIDVADIIRIFLLSLLPIWNIGAIGVNFYSLIETFYNIFKNSKIGSTKVF